MRQFFLLLTISPLLLIFNLSPVYACSGGGFHSFEGYLAYLTESPGVIVVGQFAELDDTNTNGIFEVERYLAGDNDAQYITVSMNDIRQVTNQREVHRYYPCWINKLMRPLLNSTSQYILFLDYSDDGIYRPAIRRFFQFANEDVTFDGWEQSFTSNEIQERLSELTGQSYSPVIEEYPQLPRTTPVLITTTSGQNYLIPVDSDIPVALSAEDALMRSRNLITCDTPPCVVWSPNNLDQIHLLRPDDEPIYGDNYDITQIYSVVGERISMSSSNDAFALWQADGLLEIYTLWTPDYAFPTGIMDAQYRPLYRHEIQLNPTVLNYPAVWSPDGRALVFSNEEGLWMWDVYTEDFPPQLVIPTEHSIPVARYFSPQGRYLAVTDGNRNYNLDLMTRRELPDGYLSPTDRVLLVFDTAHENGTSLEVMHLAPNNLHTEYYPDVLYHQIQWTANTSFLAVVSGTGYRIWETGELLEDGTDTARFILVDDPFFAIRSYPTRGIRDSYVYVAPYNVEPPFFSQFVYHPQMGTLDISVSGYQLRIMSNQNNYTINHSFIDLSDYIDAPIASAEWLPSAFYYAPD